MADYHYEQQQHDVKSPQTMSSLDHRLPQKGPRILACVLCQQRKKKCDRQSPCSNCIKLKMDCIPSRPAPPRKRRRPNEELLERLARCEELLRHCTCIRMERMPELPRSAFASSVESPEDHDAKTASSPSTDDSASR